MAIPGYPKSAPQSNSWVIYLVIAVGSPVWSAYAQNDLLVEGFHLSRPVAHLTAAIGSVYGFLALTGEHARTGLVVVLSLVWSQAALWLTHSYVAWRGPLLSRIELLPPLLLASLPVVAVWVLFNRTEENR